MPLRSKVRYTVYAILLVVGIGTLCNHITDRTADNGAACTSIGLVLLFLLELGCAIAERRARLRSVGIAHHPRVRDVGDGGRCPPYDPPMQKLGILAAVLGLLCFIGAIGRTVYTMATSFTAAQTDPSAPAPEFSLTGPLTIITIGVIMIVAGVVMVLAANRSEPRV